MLYFLYMICEFGVLVLASSRFSAGSLEHMLNQKLIVYSIKMHRPSIHTEYSPESFRFKYPHYINPPGVGCFLVKILSVL